MKSLCLIRHAKSSWAEENTEDFERLLNERGQSDAPKMGRKLFESGFRPDLIISSPAFRAISTARRFSRELAYDPDSIVADMRIYDARESALLDLIHHIPDNYNQVILFGHNPGLHQISNYLVPVGPAEFPTCAIAWLDFSVESWKDITSRKGKLHYYDYPKNNS
jgi:phosphohistidine phosphatase